MSTQAGACSRMVERVFARTDPVRDRSFRCTFPAVGADGVVDEIDR